MLTGGAAQRGQRRTGTNGIAVRAEAPCRADLAGGTLDIWPLGLLHPGALTVNVAIPVRVRLVVELNGSRGVVGHAVGDRPWRELGADDAAGDLTAAVCFALRPQGGLRVRVAEQAPYGSGLGGSSSYAVALARAVLALEGRTMDDRSVVALLRDLEARVLSAPTGEQDHWAAVRGGVLGLHIEAGGVRIERIAVSNDWLADRFSLFFTGLTHHSGMVNWQVIRRRLEGEDGTIAALDAIRDASVRCRAALIRGDEIACGEAIAAEWAARKRLAPEVCPPELEDLESVALAAGAAAVKACGAGGGGGLLLWHASGVRQSLSEALRAAAPSGMMLPRGVEPAGCRVDTWRGDARPEG